MTAAESRYHSKIIRNGAVKVLDTARFSFSIVHIYLRMTTWIASYRSLIATPKVGHIPRSERILGRPLIFLLYILRQA